MSADLDAVIDEVATALATIPEFTDPARRHTGTNVSRVTPPAVIVEPDGQQELDTTYRGMDSYVLSVSVIVALLGASATWREVAPFVKQTGSHSIKAAIDAHDFSSCSAVHVPSYEFVVMTFAGNQYLGVTFRAEAGG